MPIFSMRRAISSFASGTLMPSRKSELMRMVLSPSFSTKASVPTSKVAGSVPFGATTGMTGRPYLRAKSRSRWSCAGQPKMAPSP